MSLRVYTVHTPPAFASRGRTMRWEARDPLPELVKEGFSWPAFFFGFVWALCHRLWLVAAALIALGALLGAALEQFNLGPIAVSLTFFAFAVLVGLMGNDWRRAALNRRGYGEDGVVTASDMETALRRYLDLRAIGASPARAAAPAQSWGATDAGPWGKPQ